MVAITKAFAEAELGVTCLLLVGSTASNMFYLLWSSLSPSPRCPLLLVMAVSDVSMSVTSLVLQLTQPQGGVMLAFCLRECFQAI